MTWVLDLPRDVASLFWLSAFPASNSSCNHSAMTIGLKRKRFGAFWFGLKVNVRVGLFNATHSGRLTVCSICYRRRTSVLHDSYQ